MTQYVVMFPADDEAAWEAGSEADHQAVYDVDARFRHLLEERGGSVTGGAALAHSSGARTLRADAGARALVTEGPYTETVEQLSGFYLVTCEDHRALVEAAEVLVQAHPVVEIRPVEE